MDREGPVKLRGTARIKNLSPWSDAVQGYVVVFGLPARCDAYNFGFGSDPPVEIRPSSEVMIRWSLDMWCGPEVARGVYPLTVQGTVMSADGFVPYADSASTSVRLRVR